MITRRMVKKIYPIAIAVGVGSFVYLWVTDPKKK